MAAKKRSSKKGITDEVKDRIRRMKWWHEARFGMFIHWGLYSVIGRHEWAMECEAIPVDEYELLAKKFKPKPNAARAWAKLARKAGMKYMVMTTKHHEGFCLFDSEFTDYCAPKQACGRDLVREYVDAARAEGLRVGFYHSLMDWHHPDGERCADDERARKRFVAYIHGQVREICSNYGKLDILWYDVGWPLNTKGWESKKMNAMVRKLQPDIIINNRAWLPEDFSTPEQHIRAEPPAIVQNLVTCARDGGNYLLNIGPKGDGSIPKESVDILTKVGRWMATNGHTIYGADRCAVGQSLFSNATRKGNTIYLQIFHWPGESWAIGGLKAKIKSARVFKTGQRVKFKQEPLRMKFFGLPKTAPDSPVTVIELQCASRPKQEHGGFIRKKRKRLKA
jgi:alpha-L-fucosidase